MNILESLEAAGAVYDNKHFVYTTGKHGSAYINFDPLFPKTALLRDICSQLTDPFHNEFDTVVGPATGGIALAIMCASVSDAEVSSCWADKNGSEFVFERAGFTEAVRNKKVLVVEDLLNTGGSVAKVCQLVKQTGGQLVGASVVVNRGPSTAESLKIPRLNALAKVEMKVYENNDCPLCQNSKPIVVDVGHGLSFKEQNPEYAGGFISVL